MMSRMNRSAIALVLASVTLACGKPADQTPGTTSAESSGGTSSTSAGTSTDTSTGGPQTTVAMTLDGTDSSSSSTDGSGIKLDVGISDTPSKDTEAEEGCRKVDVIISIDHSDSMYEEIAAMQGPVFDSFPDALLAVNNGLDDFHLGVMDACNNPAILHDTGMTGGACDFSTGANYMVSTSPNLYDEYQCVADLAFNGYMNMPDFCSMNNDDEQPGNTAADAINPPFADDENDGFLRDDAVLFIVAMTDEDEQPVPFQTPQQIYDKIIDAKGTVDAVVFLGVAGGSNCVGPYGSAQDATNMKALTQLFVDEGHGLFWDLCAGGLEMAFDQVLDAVDSTCQNFQPPN